MYMYSNISLLFDSVPPTRTEAFEEFKTERGSEINRVLVDNKRKYS